MTLKTQDFPRAVVEFFHDLANVIVCYALKTTAFGKVLHDHAMGVFVQAKSP